MRDQLAHLVFSGCISHMPDVLSQVKDLQRYVAAIEQRLEKMGADGAAADHKRMQQVMPYWQAYKKLAERAGRQGECPRELMTLRWMVEEYRVQIFAQPFGTAIKVSAKRLDAQLHQCK